MRTHVALPPVGGCDPHRPETCCLLVPRGDTAGVDDPAHPHTSGLGPIGDGRGRGVELQSCLAVRPADQEPTPAVLGLAYQQPWTRPEVHHGPETRAQRWARARESAVWAQV